MIDGVIDALWPKANGGTWGTAAALITGSGPSHAA